MRYAHSSAFSPARQLVRWRTYSFSILIPDQTRAYVFKGGREAPQQVYEKEARVIRRMMAGRARLIYSNHAEIDRMPERNITDEDVRVVLANCRVTGIRQNKQGPVWAAEGTDLDGRSLRIPVSVRETHHVIIIVSAVEL